MGVARRSICSRPAAVLLAMFISTATAVPTKSKSKTSTKEGIAALQVRGLVQTKGRHQLHVDAQPHPGEPGHYFLNKEELAPIDTIHCLQWKQQHPDEPCVEPDESRYPPGSLSIARYPDWRENACHSNDEFFCDPSKMLSNKEQYSVSESLRLLKERTLVNCGQVQEMLDPSVERRWFERKSPVFQGRLGLEDYREFNLAIALADEWPRNEMDPKSIQYLGRRIMTNWGLMPFYNGVDQVNGVNQALSGAQLDNTNCPNTAVVFILPDQRKAWLNSPSCEFICESRGGPEVISAILEGLDRGGLEAAIQAGIEKVDQVLKMTIPLSTVTAATQKRWNRGADIGGMSTDASWIWAMRAIYIFVVAFALFCVAAFLYFQCTPDKQRRTGYRLIGADGRQGIREEGLWA